MAFLPPINLGSFKPAPATLAQWVYDIWQYLQENPIATQEDITTYIQNYFETSPEVQEVVGEVVAQYLLDNPPQAPVQSVQGKTGAVTLNYPDIVPASNAVPVYRAASAPNTSTAQGLYNNGYRLFVNTATQEIYTISNSGVLSLVGRGKFDGTTVDLDTAQGDTTIAESVGELGERIGSIGANNTLLAWGNYAVSSTVHNLSDSIENYDVIIFQSGSQTDQAPGGGAYFAYAFDPQIGQAYGGLFQLNGDFVAFSVRIVSATTVKIETAYNCRTNAAYTGTVVRQIIGLKLTA